MTLTMDGVEYLPAAAVAEELATTELKVLMLLRQKALQGELIEGSWYVTADSVARFQPETLQQQQSATQCKPACSTGCSCR